MIIGMLINDNHFNENMLIPMLIYTLNNNNNYNSYNNEFYVFYFAALWNQWWSQAQGVSRWFVFVYAKAR